MSAPTYVTAKNGENSSSQRTSYGLPTAHDNKVLIKGFDKNPFFKIDLDSIRDGDIKTVNDCLSLIEDNIISTAVNKKASSNYD